LAAVYEQLHRLARARMAHLPPGQTLQPTALVHEAYLRLVASARGGTQDEPSWDSRGLFFAAAAEAMRRILVDNARRKQAVEHGGGTRRVPLDEFHRVAESPQDLLDLDDALDRFAAEEPDKARLVHLRFFAGLSTPDAAAALGISVATAERWWTFARAWLYSELQGGEKKMVRRGQGWGDSAITLVRRLAHLLPLDRPPYVLTTTVMVKKSVMHSYLRLHLLGKPGATRHSEPKGRAVPTARRPPDARPPNVPAAGQRASSRTRSRSSGGSCPRLWAPCSGLPFRSPSTSPPTPSGPGGRLPRRNQPGRRRGQPAGKQPCSAARRRPRPRRRKKSQLAQGRSVTIRGAVYDITYSATGVFLTHR
jgi:RNA polymerase sigma factor (TIGR02999 family)